MIRCDLEGCERVEQLSQSKGWILLRVRDPQPDFSWESSDAFDFCSELHVKTFLGLSTGQLRH